VVLSGLFVPVCLCPAFLPVLGVLCESGFFFLFCYVVFAETLMIEICCGWFLQL
jgi:hypothetical protein